MTICQLLFKFARVFGSDNCLETQSSCFESTPSVFGWEILTKNLACQYCSGEDVLWRIHGLGLTRECSLQPVSGENLANLLSSSGPIIRSLAVSDNRILPKTTQIGVTNRAVDTTMTIPSFSCHRWQMTKSTVDKFLVKFVVVSVSLHPHPQPPSNPNLRCTEFVVVDCRVNESRMLCSDITNDQLGISGETGHSGTNLCIY